MGKKTQKLAPNFWGVPSGGKGFSEIEQDREAGKSKVCGKAVPLECPRGQSLGTWEQNPTPFLSRHCLQILWYDQDPSGTRKDSQLGSSDSLD